MQKETLKSIAVTFLACIMLIATPVFAAEQQTATSPTMPTPKPLTLAQVENSPQADTTDPLNPDAQWVINFAPYFWMPSVDGNATVGRFTNNVDASFHDILTHADVLGAMGHLNIQHGPIGMFIDGVYADGSTSFTASQGNLSTQNTVDFRISTIDFGAAYQVFSQDIDKHKMTLGILGGGRYTNFKQTVGIAGLGPFGITKEIGGTAEWIEPIVGGRASIGMTDNMSLLLYGDVGGFNVGYADLSWKARGVINWNISKNVALVAGYQFYYLNYTKGSGSSRNGFDGLMQGPILGVNFTF